MKFSERKGIQPVSRVVQTRGMSDDLRTSIWNALDLLFWRSDHFLSSPYGNPEIEQFSSALWFSFFKQPIDERPNRASGVLQQIRQYFFAAEWYEVYDFLEFVLNYFQDEDANQIMNSVLERELAGYRFVGGIITDITDDKEIDMLERTLENEDFPAVNAHLQRALELLSDKNKPDYRNSIKESISAVESLACAVTNDSKATLGKALKELERSGEIHPALKEAFLKLYGYASDEGGIRHAMLAEPDLSAADAKFFLLSCTSFINYLKSKL